MPPKSLTPRVPGEALPPAETDAATTAPATADAVDAAGVATDHADQLRAELEAIASLNVPEVLEALTTLNRDELILLHAIETDGKGRVTVLGPISDQLDVLAQGENEANTATAGGTDAAAGQLSDALGNGADAVGPSQKSKAEVAAEAEAAAASIRRSSTGGPVTKAEQPAAVLTADGWVVPEPEPKA
ncbi:hypothetical protein [Stenotrophomonas maltophilia]|uniref:hypothetical protein n=1 Tax=Stenotrophomonas maltophilia TaxID=40324 RepID=UPI000DA7ADB5|nr:hypothetical protein [Stenotrophomonas maltophilia]PZS74575.1 hypothetical protein A7X75_04345 [Stenotrophomonas maltophilia]QDY47291.1 hypothetical protein DUW70_01430 [Stenotrophomonas maltophilia]